MTETIRDIFDRTYQSQFLTAVNFIGITGRSCLTPLIDGVAKPLIFQTISLELNAKLNDSKRTDKTSSGIGF